MLLFKSFYIRLIDQGDIILYKNIVFVLPNTKLFKYYSMTQIVSFVWYLRHPYSFKMLM